MQRFFPITALVSLLWAGAASADGHATLDCSDLNAEKPRDAYRAFQCVSAIDDDLENARARIRELEAELEGMAGLSDRLNNLAQQIDELRSGQGFVPAVGSHADTKAIVAYTSAKGEKTCPDGWHPFEPAKDRFILGAGAAYPVVGETGGEETVTLEIPQMPTHSHGFTAPNKTEGRGSGSEQFWYSSGPFETEESGGNQPHNNMPPYIALYFCQQATE